MEPALVGKKRNLYKEPGIIVKATVKQAVNGNHGTVGGFMEAAQPVFFCLCGNQFYLLLERSIPIDVYGDQTAFLFLNDADLG